MSRFNPARSKARSASQAGWPQASTGQTGGLIDTNAYRDITKSVEGFSPLRFSQYARELERAISEMSDDRFSASSIPRVMPWFKSESPKMSEPTELPTVDIVPAPVAKPSPGSFVASIRAMMDEARAGLTQARTDGLAKVGDAVAKLGEAKVAVTQVSASMARTIEDEAASVMAELGQISNMGPE